MSNAKPMNPKRRRQVYGAQRDHRELTPRQARQLDRMAKRAQYVPSGASGIPVRRPLARSTASRKAAA